MGLDDDLFEPTTTRQKQIEVPETDDDLVQESEDGIFIDSPEIKQFVKRLQHQLDNVEDFSFVLYTRTYYLLLDHINRSFEYLFNPRMIHITIPSKISQPRFAKLLANGDTTTPGAIIECERLLVANRWYQEILSRILAQIEGDIGLEDENSYLAFTRDHMAKELMMCNFNLEHLKNVYASYGNEDNNVLDAAVLEEGIFSYLSISERDLYGNNVQAFKMEDLGEIEDAVELRDTTAHQISKMIAEFARSIQTVLYQVKSGDGTAFRSTFKKYD